MWEYGRKNGKQTVNYRTAPVRGLSGVRFDRSMATVLPPQEMWF